MIVGSVALDSVRTPFGEVTEELGGAAVYSAVAASYFAPVQLVGVVGTDFPEEHVSFLASRNIDLRGLQRAEGPTFRWAGEYEYDVNKRRTLKTELNVFECFRPNIPDPYRDAQYVFLANIDPCLQMEVLSQVRNPKLIMCDTMNFWIESKRDALLEVLKRVDVVFMNDEEVRQLYDTPSIVKAAHEVRNLGPSVVVIKKGEHGALMITDGAHFSAPSYPCEEVVDPTGAGDTFAGGFIGYVASTDDYSEANLRKAVIYGSALASFCVEDFSLRRLARLTIPQIAERYCEFKNMSFFEPI